MKSRYQLDIEEQLRNLKLLIGNVAKNPSPIEIAKATIAVEFTTSRVREFCEMNLSQGAVDGLDHSAA